MIVRIRSKPRIDKGLEEGLVLWRYLDAARLFDLLHRRRLFFNRGDQFADKFEGSFTKSIKHAIEESYRINNIQSSFSEFKKKLRERVFVNCWHSGKDDSMAMWQIYGQSPCSAAITTTIGQLKQAIEAAAIPHFVAIKKVEYVKHWRDPNLKITPYSNVFAYKVKAYDFEKEVRILIDRIDEDFDVDVAETGMLITIDPQQLLRSIVVGPEAPPWFLDLVDSYSKTCGFSVPVRRSKLTFDPV